MAKTADIEPMTVTWPKIEIFKIVKSPYLSKKLSDFDEIWYTSDIEKTVNWPKIEIFKI